MKVTQHNSPIQMDAYIKQLQQQRSQQEAPSSNTAVKGAADKVQLSKEAQEIQKAALALGQSEDVREDKVRQVRMDIENGTYQMKPAKVATDMLKEAFENNKILNSIDVKA